MQLKHSNTNVDCQGLECGISAVLNGKPQSFFLCAASTFMSATTLLAKLITKSIWIFVGKEE
jgi:hypothetical protein